MAINFGALARARASMRAGAADGEQERFRRDTIAQEQEARQSQLLFQRWATEQQLKRQAEQDAAVRQRQREQDQMGAIQGGGEDAPEMIGAQLLAGLNAMRGSGGNTAYAMQKPTTPAHRGRVGDVAFDAPVMGTTYGTAGGRTFRFDRQKPINAEMQDAQRKAALQQQVGERNFEQQQELQDRADKRAAARDAAMLARQLQAAQLQQNRPAVQRPITEGERQNAGLLQFALPAAQRVLARYDSGQTPSLKDKVGEGLKGEWYTPDWLGNLLQSDDAQQMYDDMTSVILATQYALSGKAVTETEARRLARGLVPQIGDKPGRIAQKRAEVENRMRVLTMMAGRGVDPNAPPGISSLENDMQATSPDRGAAMDRIVGGRYIPHGGQR